MSITKEQTALINKLRYMGKQYAAGQFARGGGQQKHYLEEAADEIERLAAAQSQPLVEPTADYPPRLADEVERELAMMIDRSPEPLRRLSDWLANKLDEDDWKTAERMLLGAVESAADRAQRSGVSADPLPCPQPSAQGPAELWLQLHGDCHESEFTQPVDYTSEDVTWCWHRIHESDVRYVRADTDMQAEIDRMSDALREIGDFAHDRSTGPAVPDALWEVRSMAYSAESNITSPQHQVKKGELS